MHELRYFIFTVMIQFCFVIYSSSAQPDYAIEKVGNKSQSWSFVCGPKRCEVCGRVDRNIFILYFVCKNTTIGIYFLGRTIRKYTTSQWCFGVLDTILRFTLHRPTLQLYEVAIVYQRAAKLTLGYTCDKNALAVTLSA